MKCPSCGRQVPAGRVYCDNDDRCKRKAQRRRLYEANYKSLGLFVPGILKPTKEHKRQWGYT